MTDAQRQEALDRHIAQHGEELTRRLNARMAAGTMLTDKSPIFTDEERAAFIKQGARILDPTVEFSDEL